MSGGKGGETGLDVALPKQDATILAKGFLGAGVDTYVTQGLRWCCGWKDRGLHLMSAPLRADMANGL